MIGTVSPPAPPKWPGPDRYCELPAVHREKAAQRAAYHALRPAYLAWMKAAVTPHRTWAVAIARGVANDFRFGHGSHEQRDLEGTAYLSLCDGAARFRPARVPAGGDPAGLFRGWLARQIRTECQREARRLRNGGLYHTTRDPREATMAGDAPPLDTTLDREEARRTAEPDRAAGLPLALCDDPDVSFTLSPCGLTVAGECGINEWTQAFERIRERSESLLWAIGDLAVYGVDHFGDAARRVIESAEYTDWTVLKAEYVCRRFPLGTRVQGASFTHHKVAAGLPDDEAEALLELAVKNGDSSRSLAESVKRQLAGGIVVPNPVLALTRPADRLGKAMLGLKPRVKVRLVELAAAHGIPFEGERWPAMEAVLGVFFELKAG